MWKLQAEFCCLRIGRVPCQPRDARCSAGCVVYDPARVEFLRGPAAIDNDRNVAQEPCGCRELEAIVVEALLVPAVEWDEL
jgi:hypothetical protein